MNAWYTVSIRTEKTKERSPAFDSLTKAEKLAEAVRTNPDVISATVFRSAPPVVTYDGRTYGNGRHNITDQTTWERYGHALAVYAPTTGDHHEPTTDTWEQTLPRPFNPSRTDAEKAAWYRDNPNPIPFRGVN